MMGMNDVFVLAVTKGMGAANDDVSIYNMKPDLYEIMEVVADIEPWKTFADIKDMATTISVEGYLRDGLVEYSLVIKAVQYA